MQAVGQVGRLGRMLASSAGFSLTKAALAILAKYGSAANLYLPGVGAINGITAGNWLDSAGTTAATVDNPVGLVVSAGKQVGPELVTNGNFESGLIGVKFDDATSVSTWTLNTSNPISGTRDAILNITTSSAGARPLITWAVTVVVGRTYVFSFDFKVNSGAPVLSLVNSGASNTAVNRTLSGSGKFQVILTATGTANFGAIYFGNAVGNIQLDNISVRELPGAHLAQSTAANRPVLRRGVVNHMMQSQFAAGWSLGANGETIVQGQLSPTGQNNAVKLVMSTITDRHGIFRPPGISETTGAVISVSVFAKAAEQSKLSIANGSRMSFHAVFDLANQTHGNRPGQQLQTTTSMQSVGNGWFRCGLTYTATGNNSIAVLLSGYSTQPLDSYGVSGGAGNGVDGILLFGAQVERSSSIGEYVATTTAPASSASGPFSWECDGSNDSFTSTLTPGNAGFFCASANVTDSGVLRTLLGAGAGSDASSGVWLARQVSSNLLMLQVGNGTTRNSIGAPYPVATNAVASAGWDSSAMFVGINNTETSGAKTVDCTSTNTMNLGVLTGTTNPMLGTIGATIIMSVLPTATERATLRQFIASLSGVTF